MADPVTLAALGAVALSEGVKFLYGQAGEVLKRRRDRRDAEAVELPETVFEAPPGPLRMDGARADQLEPELRELRLALAEYGQGVDEIDPADKLVVSLVDGIRRTLEAIYGQPIVFIGETRSTQTVALTGEATVRDVRGYVAGLRAQRLRSGNAVGRVRAELVEGQAVGLDVGDVG
jgi:hypothetical protein